MKMRELIILNKMLFINQHKELLKDNILCRIDNSNVALLILNILLDNKETNEIPEYKILSNYIHNQNEFSPRECTNIYDIIGVIKTYVSKMYNGKEEYDKIIFRLTECENIFNRYQEKNKKVKIMII